MTDRGWNLEMFYVILIVILLRFKRKKQPRPARVQLEWYRVGLGGTYRSRRPLSRVPETCFLLSQRTSDRMLFFIRFPHKTYLFYFLNYNTVGEIVMAVSIFKGYSRIRRQNVSDDFHC